jgi:hypothetical protein
LWEIQKAVMEVWHAFVVEKRTEGEEARERRGLRGWKGGL